MASSQQFEIDVIVIGAGPSGLMTALWLTRCGINNIRIIDKRATKVFKGQADSLQARTMEIFDSFGIAAGINKDAAHLLESQFWAPGDDGVIQPCGTAREYYPELSRFHQVLINQGRIEREFLDAIKAFGGIEVERGVMPTNLDFDDQDTNHPIRLTLQHLTEQELVEAQGGFPIPKPGDFNLNRGDEKELERKASGKEGSSEVVRAKYVIGCDGARSWTRKQLGFRLLGDGQDPLWGAMDILPVTDFPDIRVRSMINTPRGSMMMVPRENGLIRVGVKLEHLDRDQVSPGTILKEAQQLIAPYKLEYAHCDWHAVYQSNQRLGTGFAWKNRVFLAGDAVHTHSPKAGIGMNFSLQDTYNLGWKLAHVLKGFATPSILETYEAERSDVAQQLIAFDKDFSRALSGGASVAETFASALPFTSCTSIEYGPSMLTDKANSKTHLAGNLAVGRRFPSQQVVNQSDGCPLQFQERFTSDGRYRIVVFAGDIGGTPQQLGRLRGLSESLSRPDSFLQEAARGQRRRQDLFDIVMLHSSRREDVRFLDLSSIFAGPGKDAARSGYNQIYADVLPYDGGLGTAYKGYGVDRQRGCVVAVRPDGHIMFIGELEDVDVLAKLFLGTY